MTSPEQFASQLLDSSATAYAGFAVGLMTDRHPGSTRRFEPHASGSWKSHLAQRIMELSAALAAEEPELFVARVMWTREAFGARDIPAGDLKASLECINDVLTAQMPDAAGAVAGDYMQRAIAALDTDPAPDCSPGTAPGANHTLMLQYLMAVIEGNPSGAIDLVLKAVDTGLDPKTAYLEVLVAAEREVGRMWHTAEAGIAEEHLVTTTTQRAMALLAARARHAEPTGKSVLAVGVSGNAHTLGIQSVADFFEIEGWRTIHLGTDVPPQEVAAAVQYYRADLLMLSAALSVHLRITRSTIDAVRGTVGSGVKIMVGGSAFSEVPHMWERLGADGYARRADDAVATAQDLVGLAG